MLLLSGEASTKQDEGPSMSHHRRPGLSEDDQFNQAVTRVLAVAIAIAAVAGLIRCAVLLLQI
jgi:hypothetical protein